MHDGLKNVYQYIKCLKLNGRNGIWPKTKHNYNLALHALGNWRGEGVLGERKKNSYGDGEQHRVFCWKSSVTA